MVAVAGCAGGTDVDRRAPERLELDGLVIAGPPGYCVDRRASTVDPERATVLILGPCFELASRKRMPGPVRPEPVVTVTVSNGAAEGTELPRMLDDLHEFFRTEEGHAALSRSGNPATVEVLETRIEDDVLYIHARDAAHAAAGNAGDQWRALFGVNDQLLSASVSAEEGLATLDALADRIREETTAAEAPG